MLRLTSLMARATSTLDVSSSCQMASDWLMYLTIEECLKGVDVQFGGKSADGERT